jgi:spermidine synthase
MTGTAATALVLIEALGLRGTLRVAAAASAAVAAVATGLAVAAGRQPGALPPSPTPRALASPGGSDKFVLTILFTTGFASMAMEVVWTRAFTAVLKTQVYSFAMILFVYLAATLAGSAMYRRDAGRRRFQSRARLLLGMAVTALLPAVINDPRITVQHVFTFSFDPPSLLAVLASIVPLCALLGYLTPGLVDDYSSGDPGRAGTAYAANVVGCILGPLAACYGLMPYVSGRMALIFLAGPFAACWVAAARSEPSGRRARGAVVLAASVAAVLAFSRDFEEWVTDNATHDSDARIRRDSITSVAAFGGQGLQKFLSVNGVGMTTLTPITKFIAHLPLALHRGPPRSALVVCFGMGTSYRSALSWGIDTTAVELAPSVPPMFGFFFPDADRVLADPHGHIVVDDGRRYLARCGRRFDVITVDPPPPCEAAGSSLLYSTEFFALAKEHLNPEGIVQVWSTSPDPWTQAAVARSMGAVFPFVRRFGSVEGWGMYLVGSTSPITVPTAEVLATRMPPAAQADLLEWHPPATAAGYLGRVLSGAGGVVEGPARRPPGRDRDRRPAIQ